MPRDSLTPKQEAFARAYVETGNASEAYRRCYKADKMGDGTVRSECSKLLDNPNISTKLAELKAEIHSRYMITLDRLTDELVGVVDRCKEGGFESEGVVVRAIAQLSRMHGFDAKERENDRMAVGDALSLIEARRKDAEKAEGTVH